MAQPFSEETQQLLERAQCAIDRAAQLRDHTRRALQEAQFEAFRLELTVSEQLSYVSAKSKAASASGLFHFTVSSRGGRP